jgi:hypothetical protein
LFLAGGFLMLAAGLLLLFLVLAVAGALAAAFVLSHTGLAHHNCRAAGEVAERPFDTSLPDCDERNEEMVKQVAYAAGGTAGVVGTWLVARTEAVRRLVRDSRSGSQG